jgi:hypothetical protein
MSAEAFATLAVIGAAARSAVSGPTSDVDPVRVSFLLAGDPRGG